MPEGNANMIHTDVEHRALRAAQPARQQRRHLGKKLRNEGTRMPCLHCKAQAEIRTSRMLSDSMRESTYQCTNVECGHTFVAVTEVVRTLVPSATPDPSVTLPLSTHVRRGLMRAVLDNADEAPHQPINAAPFTGDLFAGGADTS